MNGKDWHLNHGNSGKRYFDLESTRKFSVWSLNMNAKLVNNIPDLQAKAATWSKKPRLAKLVEAQISHEFAKRSAGVVRTKTPTRSVVSREMLVAETK